MAAVRIFPSEREISPTVSEKTEEEVVQHGLVFFSHSLPSHSTVPRNDSRPQASPHLFPTVCSLPQATVLCAPCLRPANTDARHSLHHPETATPAVFQSAQVSTTDDTPQGEPEAEPFPQAYQRKVGRRPSGSYQVSRCRAG